MSKRNIHLLAIAPSESIQNQLIEISAQIPDVRMDVYVGNLYSAVEIVQQRGGEDYDAILSRGETASMIRQAASIPVIEFPISFYDVLYAIKLADNFNEPYAIVGFTPVTNCAQLLRDLLQLDVEIHTLFQLEDAVPLMEKLKNKGYRLIVSGMGTDAIARRNGINSILIVSGRDSLTTAVDQAVRLCVSLAEIKEKEEFLSQILAKSDFELLIFNSQKELVYSTLRSMSQEEALSLVTRRLQNLTHSDSLRIRVQKDKLVSIRERTFQLNGETYTVFYFQTEKNAYTSSKNEIRVFSRDTAVDTFLTHYLELSSNAHDSSQSIQQIIASKLPVMLLGERGVGKEQIAATIYTQGPYRNRPYMVIDLELATEKTFQFLYNHVNSPINQAEITLYFRSLDKLTPGKVDKLKNALFDSGSHIRNRVIFSYATLPGIEIPSHITSLVDRLGCYPVRMTPLRDRKTEIKPLASLYISTVDISLAKQVIGFTPQAMTLMEQYQWPGNLTQFKRIITQLVSQATSSYIQEESVRRVLNAEGSNPSASSTSLSGLLDLNRPLHSIQKDIVKAVLEETGGNQTQAAARLGICRTTLWKMIKD